MPAGALLATLPVWPVVQPREPIADELLAPGEVAVLVPLVLLFPLAWALLGVRRRVGLGVGAALVALVAGWALGTVTFADYSPPTVDDWLRYHLLTSGALVATAGSIATRPWRRARQEADEASATSRPWRRSRQGADRARRRTWTGAGAALWLAGVVALLSVPVVDGEPVPPRDAVLPLPPGVTLVAEIPGRFTLAATDGADQPKLVRRVGDHLRDTKGWRVTWYGFTPTPDVECRPAGRIANPYRLCASFHVEPGRSTVELRLGYANPHGPIY